MSNGRSCDNFDCICKGCCYKSARRLSTLDGRNGVVVLTNVPNDEGSNSDDLNILIKI